MSEFELVFVALELWQMSAALAAGMIIGEYIKRAWKCL
jgi:hypothetical protein